MEFPVKRISGENGEIFAVLDGRRYLIARCQPSIELYERKHSVPVLGGRRCHTKTTHIGIVVCVDREAVKRLDLSQWSKATSFILSGDFERNDGAFEPLVFSEIIPLEQDLGEEVWEFELVGQPDIIRKLRWF